MASLFAGYAAKYRDALLTDVIPFWERHSIDREHGGYFTCLARDGSVFDTDKFIWLQGRQAWTFAMLYNRLEGRPRWLEIARHGIEFVLGRLPDVGADLRCRREHAKARRRAAKFYNWDDIASATERYFRTVVEDR